MLVICCFKLNSQTYQGIVLPYIHVGHVQRDPPKFGCTWALQTTYNSPVCHKFIYQYSYSLQDLGVFIMVWEYIAI